MDTCTPLTPSQPWEESAGGDFLLFDLPSPPRRYQVTVTLRREADGRLPTEDQAIAELAMAALCADGLIGAWSSGQSVLSLYLDARDDAAALEAGAALARAIGGTRGASVTAERVQAPPVG
jgi:hypothetical protein